MASVVPLRPIWQTNRLMPHVSPEAPADPEALATSMPSTQEYPPTPAAPDTAPQPREIGGRDGPEPTRYGDWEKAGRCIDF